MSCIKSANSYNLTQILIGSRDYGDIDVATIEEVRYKADFCRRAHAHKTEVAVGRRAPQEVDFHC